MILKYFRLKYDVRISNGTVGAVSEQFSLLVEVGFPYRLCSNGI